MATKDPAALRKKGSKTQTARTINILHRSILGHIWRASGEEVCKGWTMGQIWLANHSMGTFLLRKLIQLYQLYSGIDLQTFTTT